jgi:hypothetical protein
MDSWKKAVLAASVAAANGAVSEEELCRGGDGGWSGIGAAVGGVSGKI